jgi:hypothetical protein
MLYKYYEFLPMRGFRDNIGTAIKKPDFIEANGEWSMLTVNHEKKGLLNELERLAADVEAGSFNFNLDRKSVV